MIKPVGIALLVLCSSMTGIWKAYDLTRRVTALESCVRLYRFFHDRLKYLQPSVFMLVNQAASSAEFAELGFLQQCGAKLRDGAGFHESWRDCVMDATGLLGKDSAALIAGLSGVLGASDLESQLSALDYGKNLLELKLSDARVYAVKHKKLYRTLGILSGVGMAILLA